MSFLGGNPISFTSSPLSMAGYTTVPTSTLDDPSQGSSSTIDSIASIVNSVGSVVLGGLAISKLPPSNNPNTITQVQSKAAGIQVTSSPAGIISSSVGGINLGFLLILALGFALIWFLMKKG